MDSELLTKIETVRDTGTAIWIESTKDIPKIDSALKAVDGTG